MDEWDLLCSAENIERGDNIIVEDENGETEVMAFIKRSGKKIYLRDCLSRNIVFCAATLEEIDGYRCIIGKSD